MHRALYRRHLLVPTAALAALCALAPAARSQDEDEEPDPAEALRAVRDRPEQAGPPAGATDAERDAWLAGAIDRAVATSAALGSAKVGIAVLDIVAGRTVYTRGGRSAIQHRLEHQARHHLGRAGAARSRLPLSHRAVRRHARLPRRRARQPVPGRPGRPEL